MTYISDYLTLEEYSCDCGLCTGLPPDFHLHDINYPYSELVNIFDSVRATWGQPIPVSSGYRCPHHNKEIGGSLCSVHVFGLALDCSMPDVHSVGELYSMLEMDFPNLRIGKYTQTGSFIHYDIGYLINPRASRNWKMGVRWYG